VEHLQRAHPARRERARIPDLQLDRARRLAVLARERLELPSIYFAHTRRVFRRAGMLYAQSPFVELMEVEEAFEATVRDRTSAT